MQGDQGGLVTATLENVRTLAVDVSCDAPIEGCELLAQTEYGQGFYAHPDAPLSIVEFPATGDEYAAQCSRAVRENANFARRLRHRHEIIDRADWEDDLFELRSSARERQGRPMHPAYMRRQSYPSDRWPDPHCKRHLTVFHGVVSKEGRLVAYCQVVECGDMARLNTILGHADYLPDRVMWLLTLEAFRWHIDECGARYGLYYTHDSGHGGGLRYFKERFGMRPTEAEWLL